RSAARPSLSNWRRRSMRSSPPHAWLTLTDRKARENGRPAANAKGTAERDGGAPASMRPRALESCVSRGPMRQEALGPRRATGCQLLFGLCENERKSEDRKQARAKGPHEHGQRGNLAIVEREDLKGADGPSRLATART